MNEQNNSQLNKPIQCLNNIWILIITVIITALIIGGGVYAWQRYNLKNAERNLQQRIISLQSQIEDLKFQERLNGQTFDQQPEDKKGGQDNITTTKDFFNTKLGIGLSYPNDWVEEKSDYYSKITLTQRYNVLYKISTTQTYPDKERPLDAFVDIGKLDNPGKLSLQEIFNNQYKNCLSTPLAAGMGCPLPEDTSSWGKSIISGYQVLRSGKRKIPEGIDTDSLYIGKADYFIVINATYYNLNNTYDLAPIFEKIVSSIKLK